MANTMRRRLTLSAHLEMFGIQNKDLQVAAWDIGIEKGALQRALAGQAISQPDAQAICTWLSRKHGIEKDGFVPGDIPGLAIWTP